MLEEFGPSIWLADGPVVNGEAGFHFPTRMAVIRLQDGGLFVWSPVALSDALREEVTALGPVTHVVAPNSLHHMFLAEWRAAFPQARLHGAPGLAKLRSDLSFDSVLGDDAPEEWAGQIAQVPVWGNRITVEVVFFHRESATVLVTDLLQQMPGDWFSGWRKVVAQLDGMTGKVPRVPRKFRLTTRDRDAARGAVAQILDWPAERLVIAHGTPLQSGAQARLTEAFAWLTV